MKIFVDAFLFTLNIIYYAIFLSVILSWFPKTRGHKFVYYLNRLTDPILAPIRAMMSRFSPGGVAGLDFSPLIAILLISLIRRIVIGVVYY